MYLLLLLLSTSYTKYKISINTKEKQKNRKAKNLTVTTSLYAQMFYTSSSVVREATRCFVSVSSFKKSL